MWRFRLGSDGCLEGGKGRGAWGGSYGGEEEIKVVIRARARNCGVKIM